MTLLSIARRVCRRVGLAQPSVVVAATDESMRRIFELSLEEGKSLARLGDWRVLRKEKTFTTVAAETQTNTPLPTDLAGFIDGTIWNRSKHRPLYGPVDPQQWQAWQAQVSFPVVDSFYLRGTSWLMRPIPVAGHTIAYEYRSSHWCQATGGGATAGEWEADTDVGLLNERLMALGIVWRFKQARGLAWEADYQLYDFQVRQELANDSPRTIIDMSASGPPTRVPGLTIPESGWNL